MAIKALDTRQLATCFEAAAELGETVTVMPLLELYAQIAHREGRRPNARQLVRIVTAWSRPDVAGADRHAAGTDIP